MKISDVTTFVASDGKRNLVFVKVSTDEEVVGIGEAYSVGPDLATAAVVADFAEWLRGKDPLRIEHVWQHLYIHSRFPGGSVVNSAISGIDQALWDIAGKKYGVPVYRLLGGPVREKVRAYLGIGSGPPRQMAERACRAVQEHGYTALKIGPFGDDDTRDALPRMVRNAAARMKAVRDVVGDDVDVGVDVHARVMEPGRAISLIKALEPYHPLFVEEPLRPENMEALAKVAEHVHVPLATGEMLYTKQEFFRLLGLGAVDVVQPDVCCAGGITECRKIAAITEACYVSVAPHNPLGPVSTAASVHLAAAIPNFLILEQVPAAGTPRADLVKETLAPKDGYFELPTGPGLGVELNEEALTRCQAASWHRTFRTHGDGSVAFI